MFSAFFVKRSGCVSLSSVSIFSQSTRQSAATVTAWQDPSSWLAELCPWRECRSDAVTPCPPTWGTLGCWAESAQKRGRLEVNTQIQVCGLQSILKVFLLEGLWPKHHLLICAQVRCQTPAWFGSSVVITTGSLWPTHSLLSATGELQFIIINYNFISELICWVGSSLIFMPGAFQSWNYL